MYERAKTSILVTARQAVMLSSSQSHRYLCFAIRQSLMQLPRQWNTVKHNSDEHCASGKPRHGKLKVSAKSFIDQGDTALSLDCGCSHMEKNPTYVVAWCFPCTFQPPIDFERHSENARRKYILKIST